MPAYPVVRVSEVFMTRCFSPPADGRIAVVVKRPEGYRKLTRPYQADSVAFARDIQVISDSFQERTMTLEAVCSTSDSDSYNSLRLV